MATFATPTATAAASELKPLPPVASPMPVPVWPQPLAGPSALPMPDQAARPSTPIGTVRAAPAQASKPGRVTRQAQPAARAEPVMSDQAFAALVHVLLTRDNRAAPFVIIDKRSAHLWLFDAQGGARGNSPVLLGLARGDDTVPGIGDKPLAQIRDAERTTPAGRFVAEPGRNARGDDVFWVDYDAAVSIHRVHAVNRGERRSQRLASPSAADNRISYGCINVPVAFYDQSLVPVLGGQRPVVYLLPESRSLQTLFDTANQAAAGQVSQPRKGS